MVAVAALAGCGGSTQASPADQARAAIERYIKAVEAKDAKAACAATSVASQRATGGTGQACVANIAAAIGVSQTRFKGATVGPAKITGDQAVVRVNLADGQTTFLAAVRENGRWKYQATAV